MPLLPFRATSWRAGGLTGPRLICWVQDLDLEGFSDQAFVLSPAPSAPGGAAGAHRWPLQPLPAGPVRGAPTCDANPGCCLRPPRRPAGAFGGGSSSSAAPLLLSTLPDAPKIRVIVRKRPLNRKVSPAPFCHCPAVPCCRWLLDAAGFLPTGRPTAPHAAAAAAAAMHQGRIPPAPLPTILPATLPAAQLQFQPVLPQELERGEGDVLECDALASCLYVNEPKVKVDLTKYNERHTFRQARQLDCPAPGFARWGLPRPALACTALAGIGLHWPANAAGRAGDGAFEISLALAGSGAA